MLFEQGVVYVVRLDRERNVLVVGYDDELFEDRLLCHLVWFDETYEGDSSGRLGAQIRSRHTAVPVARVDRTEDQALVRFSEPQRSIAPGQTIAFYDGDVVVGSGVIEASGVACER